MLYSVITPLSQVPAPASAASDHLPPDPTPSLPEPKQQAVTLSQRVSSTRAALSVGLQLGLEQIAVFERE